VRNSPKTAAGTPGLFGQTQALLPPEPALIEKSCRRGRDSSPRNFTTSSAFGRWRAPAATPATGRCSRVLHDWPLCLVHYRIISRTRHAAPDLFRPSSTSASHGVPLRSSPRAGGLLGTVPPEHQAGCAWPRDERSPGADVIEVFAAVGPSARLEPCPCATKNGVPPDCPETPARVSSRHRATNRFTPGSNSSPRSCHVSAAAWKVVVLAWPRDPRPHEARRAAPRPPRSRYVTACRHHPPANWTRPTLIPSSSFQPVHQHVDLTPDKRASSQFSGDGPLYLDDFC